MDQFNKLRDIEGPTPFAELNAAALEVDCRANDKDDVLDARGPHLLDVAQAGEMCAAPCSSFPERQVRPRARDGPHRESAEWRRSTT